LKNLEGSKEVSCSFFAYVACALPFFVQVKACWFFFKYVVNSMVGWSYNPFVSMFPPTSMFWILCVLSLAHNFLFFILLADLTNYNLVDLEGIVLGVQLDFNYLGLLPILNVLFSLCVLCCWRCQVLSWF
jgi:hypothetical protein